MGVFKILLTVLLVAGAAFLLYSPGEDTSSSTGSGLEVEKAAELPGKLTDGSTPVDVLKSQKGFTVRKSDDAYPSDVGEDFKGLDPLQSSPFSEVYKIGSERVKDLSRFILIEFNGTSVKELEHFTGSTMSQATDISVGKENIFIGFRKKVSSTRLHSLAGVLIYDRERGQIVDEVILENLYGPPAVAAGENSFYVLAENRLLKFTSGGDREWSRNLSFEDYSRERPFPILEKSGGGIYPVLTLSNGKHEVFAGKFTSSGEKEWNRKLDLKGIKERARAVTFSNGLVIAANSKYTDSYEPFMYPVSDAVFKKLGNTSGETKWTTTYDIPGASNERVSWIKASGKGLKAFLKVDRVLEVDFERYSSTEEEKKNSVISISDSGQITDVSSTENYSSSRGFSLESFYGVRNEVLSRLRETGAERIKPEKPNYTSHKTYRKALETYPAGRYQQIRDTEMELDAFSSGGKLMLRIENTGSRNLKTKNFTAYYGPPRWGPVRYSTLTGYNEPDLVLENQENQCLTEETELTQGEKLTCLTGLKFPENGTVKIKIRADNFDYDKSLIAK